MLPYPGYGGHGRVRILGRVLLAPAATDPAARRGLPGWQRLLTLELPDEPVHVAVDGQEVTVRSDQAGLVDVTLEASPAAGPVEATLTAGARSTTALVHVAVDSAETGVVCDIDDTVWVTGLHHPLRAGWRTITRASGGRQAVPSNLLSGLTAQHPGAPVVYLSNGPRNLAGPVTRFLERTGFPAGALLMTDWGITPRAWFRDGKAHKRSSLDGWPGTSRPSAGSSSATTGARPGAVRRVRAAAAGPRDRHRASPGHRPDGQCTPGAGLGRCAGGARARR